MWLARVPVSDAGVQQCISHVSHIRGEAVRRRGGAAPSVATAGRPRLERHWHTARRSLGRRASRTNILPTMRSTYDSSPWTFPLDSDLPCWQLVSYVFVWPLKGFHPAKLPIPSVTSTLEIEMLRGLSNPMGCFDVI